MCNNRWVAIRKQIVVSEEIDARIRALAEQRGLSQSALIAEAVRALADPKQQMERMRSFDGIIKGAPPKMSTEIDKVLYGKR